MRRWLSSPESAIGAGGGRSGRASAMPWWGLCSLSKSFELAQGVRQVRLAADQPVHQPRPGLLAQPGDHAGTGQHRLTNARIAAIRLGGTGPDARGHCGMTD
jgi:hypothetical protein